MPRQGHTLITRRAQAEWHEKWNEYIDPDAVANCEHRGVPTVRGIDDNQVGRAGSERLAQGTACL